MKPLVIRAVVKDPQPWPRSRARVDQAQVPGGKAKVRFFVPKDTKAYSYKLDVAAKCLSARPPGWPLDAGYQVDLLFLMPRDSAPAGFLPAIGPRALHPHKPDKDNLTKAVYDALKNVAWKDDSQVVDGREVKLYAASDEKPHVVIVIRPKNPAELPGLDTMF